MRAKTNYAERPAELEVFTGDEGQSVVVFRLNIEEVPREGEGEEGTAYTADEYRLTVPSRANLEQQIREHIEDWRNRAVSEDYATVAAEVRAKRNALLDETDKDMAFDRLQIALPENVTAITLLTGFVDFIHSLKNIVNGNMARYRKALRDLPEQPGFPYDVTFPDKPE